MTAALTPEQRIEALMDVVDDYAEARHVFGHRTYNQKTELARKKVAQRIEALEAELAACKRDAERYRRLRLTASRCKDPAPTGCIRVLAEYVPDENWNPYQDVQTDLDCAIDAAMAAGEKA